MVRWAALTCVAPLSCAVYAPLSSKMGMPMVESYTPAPMTMAQPTMIMQQQPTMVMGQQFAPQMMGQQVGLSFSRHATPHSTAQHSNMF